MLNLKSMCRILAFLDEKIDTIYKDNVMYISYPEGEVTTPKTEDVEIWHSGIDSTIDSA